MLGWAAAVELLLLLFRLHVPEELEQQQFERDARVHDGLLVPLQLGQDGAHVEVRVGALHLLTRSAALLAHTGFDAQSLATVVQSRAELAALAVVAAESYNRGDV